MNKFLFFFLSNCVESRKSGCEKCDGESSHKYIIYYLNVTRTQRGSRDLDTARSSRPRSAALETTHFFKRILCCYFIDNLLRDKKTIDTPEDLKLGERKIHEDSVSTSGIDPTLKR